MTGRREATGFGDDGGTGGRIRETAHEAQERVSDAAREVRDRGERLVEGGIEKGRELTGEAQHMAKSRAAEGKERLAEGMRAVARALRRGSEELPEEQHPYARIVEGIADRVDHVSRFLDQHGVDELSREATRFAREHAPIVLGSAFVLGMAGARFLKSGPEEPRYESPRRELPYEGRPLRGAAERFDGGGHWPPSTTEDRPPIYPRQEGDGHARGI